ncbi:MAG: TetR/AcrR family transcriptional regulator [Flavobacteriaceae bacterium]|nr:TetR/AcrR family transcriptional regulator [Flavobacteriaceae bacterium]
MKTKDKIKTKAIELFNSKGFKNVTLREVAKELDISYGNVTYHFKTKKEVIELLYEDMLAETKQILQTFDMSNLFKGVLEAPKLTFQIAMKYLFFYVDYVEVKRSYIKLAIRIEKDNEERKFGYLLLLNQLQKKGVLRGELTQSDLDYLMNLSGAMRTFFFINLHPDNFNDVDLEKKYVNYVNQLVYPYLTQKGIEKYKEYLS